MRTRISILLTVAMVVAMIAIPALAVSAAAPPAVRTVSVVAPVQPSVVVKQTYPFYTGEKLWIAGQDQINIGGALVKAGGISAFMWLRSYTPGNWYPGNVNPNAPKFWLDYTQAGVQHHKFLGYALVAQPLYPNSGATMYNLVVNKSQFADENGQPYQDMELCVQFQGGGVGGFNPNEYVPFPTVIDVTYNWTWW